jgi:hypothetical protein
MKKILLSTAFIILVCTLQSQVLTKISQMPVLTDPTGAFIPVIKGGSNYKILVDSIKGKLNIANVGSGFRVLSGAGNFKSFVGAGKATLDSTVSGQIRITVPATLSSYTNDAGFLTAVPGIDAVTTGGGNNVTQHNLTVGDLTSFDNLGGSGYVQVSGLNQRITFSGTSLLNLLRTNVSGTTKSLQFPNISGNLAEGVTDGTTTVHAGTDGAINISTLSDWVKWHLAGVAQTLTYAGSMTLNCSNGYVVNLTLTGNGTISSITNVPNDRPIIIHVFQDATGGRTLTFPSNTVFPLGYATGTTLNLTTTGAAMDKISLTYNSASGNYEVEMAKNYGHP